MTFGEKLSGEIAQKADGLATATCAVKDHADRIPAILPSSRTEHWIQVVAECRRVRLSSSRHVSPAERVGRPTTAGGETRDSNGSSSPRAPLSSRCSL